MKTNWNCLLLILIGCFSLAVLYGNTNQRENMGEKEGINEIPDSPEQIYQWIAQAKVVLEKNSDQLPDLITKLESGLNRVKDISVKAVLHSMLAEMYQGYYTQYNWQINQRTPVSGYIPEDIREWTSNLFTEKIRKELKLSLQSSSLLQSIPTNQFQKIIEVGSSDLTPTLYDFLARRALDIQPTDSIYHEYLSYRRTRPFEKTTVLAELAYIQYSYPIIQEQITKLDALLEKYKGNELSVEIINAKLDFLDSQKYSTENPDSIMAIQWQLAQETIRQFPSYDRIGLLQNKIKSWENPFIQIEILASVYPGKEIPLTINYMNTSKVKVYLYQSGLTPEQIITNNYRYGEQPQGRGKLVYKNEYSLPVELSYKKETKEILLPGVPEGMYELVVQDPGQDNIEIRRIINVTTLATNFRIIPGRGIEIYLTDLLSGKPVTGISVNYYTGSRNNMKQAGSVVSDKDGIALLPSQKEILGFAAVGTKGNKTIITSVYSSYYNSSEEENSIIVSLLTDRKLYRPGQTVRVKGIAYTNDKENPAVVANRSFTVSFYDANNQEISKQMFISNPYGSFNGEFTIPQQGLTGTFSLRTTDGQTIAPQSGITSQRMLQGSATIQVEEYKRPSFFIEFNPVMDDIARGDQVIIKGKAETFSGIPLAGTEGTFRVTRSSMLLRINEGRNNPQVAEGTFQITADGTFSIQFRTEKGEGATLFPGWDRYQVSVILTDSKGESQESSTTFMVGEKSLQLLIQNLHPKEEKENIHISVLAQTMNGQKVTTKGTFRIYPLQETAKEGEWKEGALLVNGDFETGKEISPALFPKLPSGRYRIIFEALDSQGRKAESSNDVILYSKKDKSPPVFSPLWLVNNRSSYLPGETVEIVVGSSFKDAWVLYEIFDGIRLVNREIIRLSNQNNTLQMPFREEWKNGIMVSFTLVKDGKLYRKTQGLYRQYPDRTLTFRPQVFRDRLKPGQEEKWSFRVTDANSLAVKSEILALMYDKSLDQIYPSGIQFSFPNRTYVNIFQFTEGEGLRSLTESMYGKYNPVQIPEFTYDKLDWQGISFIGHFWIRGISTMRSKADTSQDNFAFGMIARQESSDASDALAGSGIIVEESDKGDSSPVLVSDIRQNFNETAFFYPDLLSDPDGNIHFSFTIPESNTTWQLQLLGHTQDMKYGLYKNQVITQKPVMVIPNLPRFVRKGDKVTISAQVVNQTAASLTGTTIIEFFDPLTDKTLNYLNGENRKEVVLSSGEMKSVFWEWRVPYTEEMIGVRVLVTTPEGSDGEQHLLPVVSDEILVTEATPFYLGEETSKTIQLNPGLYKTGNRPLSLTFELTANPIWYAAQALPTLSEPKNDNLVDWFNVYYSNVLARALVNSTPRLQAVISSWNKQGGNAETLLSQLEKNEELKQILLTETPWVLEAQNEHEQIQRLSLLFDLNRATWQKENAFRKIQELQQENGAWGWFKRFFPNRSMTLYVLKGMAQLTNLNSIEYNQEEKEMQIKALNWLDKIIKEDYEGLQKNKKSLEAYTPSSVQIEYLWVRSAFRDIPEQGDSREAIRYFTTQAEKQWEKLSLKDKAMVASLLYRNGNKTAANKIVDWFRKTATYSEEQGMYWANNRSGNSFFSSIIEVHTQIMEMFNEVSPNESEVNRMKQWLLTQKRTQSWNTAPSTVYAIYTLLKTGSDWLESTDVVQISWNDKTISSNQGELGTGYRKETIFLQDKPSVATVAEVKKEGSVPAWGAVYSQYFAQIENVEQSKSVLNVEKKLFIETNSGTQRQIVPVTADRPLRVGDKVIVRLTIRNDREMNYIYLHDLRPGYMEPAAQLSGAQYQDGIIYYRSPRDLSENFFIERLPAGTFVMEYGGYVSRTGNYSDGVTTIECLYAPEYISHTAGGRIEVE